MLISNMNQPCHFILSQLWIAGAERKEQLKRRSALGRQLALIITPKLVVTKIIILV